MVSAKVMIVEDEYIIATDLSEMVESLGYQVCARLDTGEEAVQQALSERPDLVLMDIRLRGRMDGLEAASEIERRLNVPVVFLTACNEHDLAARHPFNPRRFIPKPFASHTIEKAITQALDNR
ncbi:MAG: response regulator [Thermodesulfobacteriota bacterium]